MKLDQFRDVIAIADFGGMRPAARHLGVPQPALTRNLRNLERELGIQVFERKTRGMKPTERGRIVVDHARKILQEVRVISETIGRAELSHKKAELQNAGASASHDIFNEHILEVFRLNGRLLAAGDHFLRPIALTASRWQVLGALAHNQATVSHVAAFMGLRRQSIQRTINLLVREGLAKLVENPRDRRSKIALLTPAGQAKARKALELRSRWVRRLAIGISKNELEVANALMRRIGRLLEEERRAGHDSR